MARQKYRIKTVNGNQFEVIANSYSEASSKARRKKERILSIQRL